MIEKQFSIYVVRSPLKENNILIERPIKHQITEYIDLGWRILQETKEDMLVNHESMKYYDRPDDPGILNYTQLFINSYSGSAKCSTQPLSEILIIMLTHAFNMSVYEKVGVRSSEAPDLSNL